VGWFQACLVHAAVVAELSVDDGYVAVDWLAAEVTEALFYGYLLVQLSDAH
jgi:hypothetical protein